MSEDTSKNQKVSVAFPVEVNKQTTTGLQICDVGNPGFDMTTMLAAAQTYVRLNAAVNTIIGMEVRWFRAVPQIRSQDVIFQEYTLFNVEDVPLCLKIVLPDGAFPDSKYNYDLMGLEYEVPLEIQVDKAYWEGIAGVGTAPQKGDIVYFAVPNKLYEVVSSYLLRGFFEQETTWKINMRKYQPTASRKEGENLTQTIDDYTVSAEEIFGEKLESDIQKITDDKQMSPFNSTSRDKYKAINEKLVTISDDLNIYGTVVAQSYYDLNTSSRYTAVKYNGTDHINIDQDRSITAWVKPSPEIYDEHDVTSLIYNNTLPMGANFELKIKTKTNPMISQSMQIGAYLEISRPGALNFFAKIIDITEGLGESIYSIKIDDAIIDHLDSIKSNWSTMKNFKLKVKDPISILNGEDDTRVDGFRVELYANQYMKIRYGSQEHIAIITDKLLDYEWYGIIVNIGNSWGQYNTYIYRKHETDDVTKLKNIFYETMDFRPESTIVNYYSINKSPAYITNLRLYTSTIEEEKQMNELLSYFVKDGDQLIIGDNADPKFNAPYIGQQR